MLAAELDHLPDAAHSQPRLGRARLVVQPGVQHATVMARLVPSNLAFLLEDGDIVVWKSLAESVRRGESDDPATDNRDLPRDTSSPES